MTSREDKIAATRARCHQETGWECSLGCGVRCKKRALARGLAKTRRGRRIVAQQHADRYAARVEALAAEQKRAQDTASAPPPARRKSKRAADPQGYDGQSPVLKRMRFGRHETAIVNTATRKVAELRRRDDSWSEDMERAAVKFEHDWRMVNEPAVRGQAIKEFVDGGGHGIDPNLPIIEAGERLNEARQVLGEYSFNLLVIIFVIGDPIHQVTKLGMPQHRVVSDMAKEALNSLAIHYGFTRSHLSNRRLEAMEIRIASWLKTQA